MIIFCKRLIAILSVFTLISCGGGGAFDNNSSSSTDSTSNTTTTDTTDTDTSTDITDDKVTVTSLEVAASSLNLNSDGQVPVVISAIAKDANNNVLPEAKITFAVDNDATISPDADTAEGAVKTAQLTPGLGVNGLDNRPLIVTVSSDDQVQTLNIDVAGSTVLVDGPSNVVIGKWNTFTVKARDSSGKGIGSKLINIKVGSSINSVQGVNAAQLAGAVAEIGVTTDNNGEGQFLMYAGKGGIENLTATALGATYTKQVSISGDEFSLKSAKEEITVNTPETITLTWALDHVPQADKIIDLTATRGVLSTSSVTTNSEGQATFEIESATAGGTVITATAQENKLTASVVREFVATVPYALNLQVENSNVVPEGSTSVIALVRDVNDNPVKNQVIAFNLNDAVNGKLNSSSATTDSLGRATIVYTAGNATSAKDGIVIDAHLQSVPTINDQITLTVGSRALRLVLGDDENLVEQNVNYKKQFSVIVTDANGNAVANQVVEFSLAPIRYYKGRMFCFDSTWGAALTSPVASDAGWLYTPKVACAAEDVDSNGQLDAGEDVNNNDKLDPTVPASVGAKSTTDASGVALVDIEYGQRHALWTRVRLTARVNVVGTEFQESTEFDLPILASDVASCDTSPPNVFSPYGIAANCADPN